MITRFLYESLRNETHAAYHETVVTLFGTYTPASLDIALQYSSYKTAYDDEILALDVVRRSELTVQIAEQDAVRDTIFRGFADSVKSATKHFDPEKRSAALRLQNTLTAYGNIAARTLDRETAAIDDLQRELITNYELEITNLGLGDWLTQLAAENSVLKTLILDRYSETAQRPAVKMKSARTAVDVAFRAMLNMLDALVLVNGEASYKVFIAKLNAVSERYKNILAQEAGVKKKGKIVKNKSI